MQGYSLLSVAAGALFFATSQVLADDDDTDAVVVLGEYTLTFASESVEYDSVNERYYYENAFGSSISYIDASNVEAIINGSVTAVDDAFDFDGHTPGFLTGMWTNGESLYVNDFYGSAILKFDIETMSYVDNITVMYNGTSSIPAQVNGMCVDPNDEDTLYITDAGISVDFTSSTEYGMIYKVTLSTGAYEKVYDNSDSMIYPNGCIVDDDGVLYTVEFVPSGTNHLIVWDTSDDSWEFYEISNRADGIILTDEGDLYFTGFADTVNETNALYQLIWENDGYTQELVVDDLVAPADICYDSTHGIIVIPSLNAYSTDNSLTFVYVYEDDSAMVYLPSVLNMIAFTVAALIALS